MVREIIIPNVVLLSRPDRCRRIKGRERKPKFDGVVVNRQIHADGTISTSDRNGRMCWDTTRPQRVVLTNDLRKYGPALHIGQLGWTIPSSTDGYKWIDVE